MIESFEVRVENRWVFKYLQHVWRLVDVEVAHIQQWQREQTCVVVHVERTFQQVVDLSRHMRIDLRVQQTQCQLSLDQSPDCLVRVNTILGREVTFHHNVFELDPSLRTVGCFSLHLAEGDLQLGIYLGSIAEVCYRFQSADDLGQVCIVPQEVLIHDHDFFKIRF